MKKLTGLGLALFLCVGAASSLFTGCAGNRTERSTGEYIDDKAVQARVKSALGDHKEYKFGDVEVKAFKGSVQLSGFVNSDDQKDKAAEIAKKVDGVREVINNISIKK